MLLLLLLFPQMGFFADAGPLQIFVSSHVSGAAAACRTQPHSLSGWCWFCCCCFSTAAATQRCVLHTPRLTSMCWLRGCCSARLQQLIPDDYEYSSVNGDAFVSTDATSQIKEGTEVRIKIVGVRADPHDMVRAGWRTALHSTAHRTVCVLIP